MNIILDRIESSVFKIENINIDEQYLGDNIHDNVIFTTTNGYELTYFVIEFNPIDNFELIDIQGHLENNDLIITGQVLNADAHFCGFKYGYGFEINAIFNATINITINTDIFEENLENIPIDKIELSDFKIISIDGFGNNANRLSLILLSNNYKKFFKDYNITTLKDGTLIDSLSKKELIDYYEYNDLEEINEDSIDINIYCEEMINDIVNIENLKDLCSQIQFTGDLELYSNFDREEELANMKKPIYSISVEND